jgi:enoyl-CoA hydratase/carnithine racemase
LNRPEKLNAMNRSLNIELQSCFKKFDADPEIGCIVITGSGERAFSAGGDIHEQVSDEGRPEEEVAAEKKNIRYGFYELSASDTPTIGMMNGLAFGGAAVLSSSLDMRIGCERTKFRFLAAAYRRINSTWTLPNQVGWPIAKELLFTARVVEAEEAYRIGLLNHLVPSEKLREKTMEIAKMISGNHFDAVVGCKRLMLQDMTADLEQQWHNEQNYARDIMPNAKATEAFPEFLARKGQAAE